MLFMAFSFWQTTDEDEVNVEVERVLAEIAVTVTADAPVNVPTRVRGPKAWCAAWDQKCLHTQYLVLAVR
jgi:hypothetical protein